MKRCNKCKSIFNEDFAFCPKCGGKLSPFEEETKCLIEDGILYSITPSNYTNKPTYWYYLEYFLCEIGLRKEEWEEKAILNIPNNVYKIQARKECICKNCIFSDVNFPSSIQEVDSTKGYFFQDCRIIGSVRFPSGWKRIGATFYCSAVGDLYIPNGVEALSVSFLFKSNAGKIVLPPSLKRIEEHAIYDTSIKEMVVPSSVTYWALGTYGCGFDHDSNKIDNLIYQGSRYQLKNLFERTLRELPPTKKNKDIHVNERQIIHCNDGDVRLKSVDKYTFTVENI